MRTAIDFFSDNIKRLSPEQHPVEYATQEGLLDLAQRLVLLTQFPEGLPGLAYKIEALREHVADLQADMASLQGAVRSLSERLQQSLPPSS